VNPDAFHSAIHLFNAAAAGLSFWFTSAPHRIVYSTDFGETFTSAGISSDVTGVLRNLITTVSYVLNEGEEDEETISYVMACTRTDEQAYTWDETGLTFIEDGTTGADTILAYFRLGENLYALCNGGAPGQAAIYGTPFGQGYKYEEGDGVRLIDIASDNKYFYLTANADGTLRAYAYRLSNRHFVREWDFGAATFAEIDARTYALRAQVKPGTDKIIYLYGRDGNDVQIQKNDLNGADGWQSEDDGGWGSTKVAIAMLIDPLEPNNILVCFADDDIYQSTEPTIAWTKLADAPTTLKEAARHRPDDRRHVMLAADSADTIYFSHNLGLTTFDVSDAALDTINAIEVSRE
jgi:hypothetical protein